MEFQAVGLDLKSQQTRAVFYLSNIRDLTQLMGCDERNVIAKLVGMNDRVRRMNCELAMKRITTVQLVVTIPHVF